MLAQETRKYTQILNLFGFNKEHTVGDVVNILKSSGFAMSYETVSGYLYNMKSKGVLIYGTKVGPKGGKSYKLAPKKRTFKISFKVPTIHEDHN